MRKFITIITFITLITVILPKVYGQVSAAFLKFDKTSVSVKSGETFSIQVIVDAGTENILGVDAYILYDSALLEAQSVANGTFFDSVVHSLTTAGKAYIAGLVEDPATSRTGTGTIATITFKALKSGSGTLSYDCRTGASDSSKVVKNDIDATNIIECSKNGSSSVTVSGGTSTIAPTTASSDSTTTPSELPESGIFDNILKYSIPGFALILLGGVAKLLL